mgnify:FL=1
MLILENISPAIVVLGILAAVGVYYLLGEALRRIMPKPYRRANFAPFRSPGRSIGDSADQLRVVMRASFAPKKVMSLSEYKVFRAVEMEMEALRGGYRVFAQTCLGEVLTTESWAHPTINSKRVDVLVVGPGGLPTIAVEYQGGGHYQGDAAARDAVKREVLRKAGVAYLEITNAEDADGIRRAVRVALHRTAPPAAPQPHIGSVTDLHGVRG